MRALLQRVTEARVAVAGTVVGAVGPGLLVLLGVGQSDGEAQVTALAAKVAKLRIFSDEAGKMNRSVQDVGGAALVISQFTLYADARRGNRPSFVDAAPPAEAERLYGLFAEQLRARGLEVATGVFGAEMQVSLTNDGPVTLLLEV